jgi:VWFA-related protein
MVVEVAVVARDANDMPVVDLRGSDLRVLDNGVEQSVLSFDLLGASEAGDGEAARAPAPRLSIVLLDALNTSPSNQVFGRRAISEMLGSLPPGGDRIEILELGEHLDLVWPFSSNPATLRAALDAYEGAPPADGAADTGWAKNPDPDPSLAEKRLAITLAAFQTIAGEMKDVPGEKSLLWITGGFPPPDDHQSIADGTRALAAARVMLYPVDARGLVACPGGQCPPWINSHIASMEEMAEQTGGRAFHDGNDLALFARAALDDSREGYLLTYSPSRYKQDGSAHVVEIRTSRKGVRLRYRPGYFADPVAKPAH